MLAKHTCSYSHIYYETKSAFFLELKVPSDSKDQKIPGHLLGSGRLTLTELTSVTGVSIWLSRNWHQSQGFPYYSTKGECIQKEQEKSPFPLTLFSKRLAKRSLVLWCEEEFFFSSQKYNWVTFASCLEFCFWWRHSSSYWTTSLADNNWSSKQKQTTTKTHRQLTEGRSENRKKLEWSWHLEERDIT